MAYLHFVKELLKDYPEIISETGLWFDYMESIPMDPPNEQVVAYQAGSTQFGIDKDSTDILELTYRLIREEAVPSGKTHCTPKLVQIGDEPAFRQFPVTAHCEYCKTKSKG